MTVNSDAITAALVSDEQRLFILPRFFGYSQMLRAEALVYGYMSKLSVDYTGGYWHFYELSNGGFYMAPEIDKAMHIEWHGNEFSGLMTADAAGLVATMFAVSHLAAEVQSDELADLYHQLRDFACSHPEAKRIIAAID